MQVDKLDLATKISYWGSLNPPLPYEPGYERQVLSLGPDLHPQHWLRAFATAVLDRASTCTFTGFNRDTTLIQARVLERSQSGAACHPSRPCPRLSARLQPLRGDADADQLPGDEGSGRTAAVSCDGGPLSETPVRDGRLGPHLCKT